MKIDIDLEQNYDVSNMNHGDTWFLDGDIYIIAWVDGVTFIDPLSGVNVDDVDSYNVLIGLKDGTPWTDPSPMEKIANILKNNDAIKVDTKVVTV